MTLTDQDFKQLEQLYFDGEFSELESVAIKLTTQYPHLGVTWSVLGAALTAQGKPALEAQARAAELLPKDPQAQLQYADALLAAGQFDDAVATYKRTIALQPDWAAAYNNLGNAFMASGKIGSARYPYEQALQCDPRFALAHYNLALLNRDDQCWDDVEPELRLALDADPSLAPAWVELASVLKDQGKLADAEAALVKAIELSPQLLQARLNLSAILRLMGRFSAADDTLRQLLRLDPEHDEALAQLGTLLFVQTRLVEAEQSLRLALRRNPLQPTALASLADVAAARGNMPLAISLAQQSVAADPTRWDVRSKLLFYAASNSEGIDPSILGSHRDFGTEVATRIKCLPSIHSQPAEAHRTLRIGFVSGDFREHIVSEWLEPILEQLTQHNDLHLVAYYTHPDVDDFTRKMQRYFGDWHAVAGMEARLLAGKIREHAIDILIDLSGHTGYNALPAFAYKPAPLQASWLGYALTTGMSTIDYYLAEEHWLPPGKFDHWFTEKLAYLPPYSHVASGNALPEVNELPALVNGHLTFGSFNHFRKISANVIKVWSRVLTHVPGSRMLIGAISAQNEQETIVEWFVAQGIDPGRLDFALRCDRENFLRLFHRVDICLDSFPYPGATTTSYALWMGVPTVTLSGSSPMERVGANLISSLGIGPFIADSSDQFVDCAVHWANHPQQLEQLRRSLRKQLEKSPISNPGVIAQGLRASLRRMWQLYCRGEPPTSLTVSAY